ncbi:MAG TPA: hypothetical protein VNX02_04085 [Steroidobacteraceae bacterium]|jgi:hypothetical protein|nr:hypothetical protein [Steroidobacteraceae bacterium]
MDAPCRTTGEDTPQTQARWDTVINWLALLMLLAGSVVWPR